MNIETIGNLASSADTSSVELQDLQSELRRFAEDRDWEQFHTLRNLLFALIAEMGELAETVQWQEDASFEKLEKDIDLKKAFEEEISDVFLYLIRLADLANIDLVNTAYNKIQKNSERYSIEKAKGNSRKQPK